MNPYERTAQEMKRQSEGPKRFANTAIKLGGYASPLAFAPILAKAAPLLSEYVPEDFAIKGLSKISPKFGSFIKTAMDSGFDFQELRNFIGNQIKDSQPQTQQQKNIIEQYSPELHEYISGEIKNGRTPLQAGALALSGASGKNFKSAIDKITKDHKTPWSNILETVYGAQGSSQQNNQQETPLQQQGVQQQAQVGSGQEALVSILQKINQKLGQ